MPTVTFNYEGDTYETSVAEDESIAAALEQVGINPQAVVIKHGDTVKPHPTPITEDREFDLIRVVSGG